MKKQVLELLALDDFSKVLETISTYPAHEVVNPLFASICRGEEIIRWHAISCMGPTVSRIADEDMEQARIIMRRFMWSLNDESGGIGWGAPESLAEVMVYHEGLAKEYHHILISYMQGGFGDDHKPGNFLEHLWLQRGVLWGVNRLIEQRPEMIIAHNIGADVTMYLASSDSTVRGLAVFLLGYLGEPVPKRYENILLEDNGHVRLYKDGMFYDMTVAEIMKLTMDARNVRTGKRE